HRAEEGEEFVELHLPDLHVVQDVSGEGLELLRRFDQPLQYGIRVHLEHPRRPPDTQALGQTGDHPHDQLRGHAFAMKDRAEGLEKVTTTDHTQELPPGTPIGMAIGAEIAPADPAAIGTVGVRAEVHRGVDLAAAPPHRLYAGWRA